MFYTILCNIFSEVVMKKIKIMLFTLIAIILIGGLTFIYYKLSDDNIVITDTCEAETC